MDQQLLAAIILGVVGLWLGHSYRRSVRQQATERLLDAYEALWELTGRFGKPEARDPIDDTERRELGTALERWYCQGGAGMLLPWNTRELLFVIRDNLLNDHAQVQPPILAASLAQRPTVDANLQYECAIRRQLSLLRSQLKADVAMYRRDQHLRRLRPDERELLRSCGIHRRWHQTFARLPLGSGRIMRPSCACGYC